MVVPYPGSGNINPALQLALLLRYHGIFITFVVTEHNLRRAQAAATEGAVSSCDDAFWIETIPDGLVDADRDLGLQPRPTTTGRSRRSWPSCGLPRRAFPTTCSCAWWATW